MKKEEYLTDTDILQLIEDFKEWRASHPTDRDGLDQMLGLLERHLRSNVLLTVGLQQRLLEQTSKLVDQAAAVGEEIFLAAQYVQQALAKNLATLDYDPAFLACGAILGEPYGIDQKSRTARRLEGEKNALFGDVFLHRQLDIGFSRNRNATLRPLGQLILAAGFNMPFYANSMHMGLNAWDDGRNILDRIWGHISSPNSIGQQCSLFPENSPASLTHGDLTWIDEPAHQKWLNDGYGEPPMIPQEIKEIMHYPKGRH